MRGLQGQLCRHWLLGRGVAWQDIRSISFVAMLVAGAAVTHQVLRSRMRGAE